LAGDVKPSPPAEQGLDHPIKSLGTHRFHDVGVGTERVGEADVTFEGGGREYDDGQKAAVLSFAAPAKHIEAVHAWHLKIKQHEIGFGVDGAIVKGAITLQVAYQFLAVRDSNEVKIGVRAAERSLKKEGVVFVVLGDQ
jgi:hypothetical protein